MTLSRNELRGWLLEQDPQRLAQLWAAADAVRRDSVGDAIYLRGLVELSNICARSCVYCGVRRENREIERYRMTLDEIVGCAAAAASLGIGTVVLQGGHDPHEDPNAITAIIHAIRAVSPVAITLSLGEHPRARLAAWRAAGADRYLLRFETSNPTLYARLHPRLAHEEHDRMQGLAWLRELDYEVGSGVMVGIPGQSVDDLVRDLELFRTLDLDMIGVGPFIPHGDTPLAKHPEAFPKAEQDQVVADVLTTLKVIALTRLLCPWANLPSTTALVTLGGSAAREASLNAGANIIMPNFTPTHYREQYEVYPGKSVTEPAQVVASLHEMAARLGRTIGHGPGHAREHSRASGQILR